MPVLYSAQNLTSSEYLSHSALVLAWSSATYLVILLSSSLKSWASWGTLSPWGRSSFSVEAFLTRISILAAMSSWSMLPLWFLISSSSAVAASFQLSMAFREASKALSSAQNSPSLSTLSLNLPETSSFSLTALISFSMIFFLSLNQLINIFNTGRSNVSGGRHHDTIKELNMGLQLITIGIALPVQVHHNLGLSDGRDELFMLLDEGIQFVRFILLLILGSFSHQDLKDLSQPLLDLSPFQIFAQSVEVISLSLEFGGSIDFVGHDASDGLFDVLHPLGHLLVAHVVDILDEVVVLLPERHLDPELLLPVGDVSSGLLPC